VIIMAKGRGLRGCRKGGGADINGCLALQLQLHLQRLYMPDLVRIERLCIRLDVLRGDDAMVRRLKEMHVNHIKPLIGRLKAPKSQVGRGEMAWLMKMSRVLPPFLKELDSCYKELQDSNKQAFIFECIHRRVAAAAA